MSEPEPNPATQGPLLLHPNPSSPREFIAEYDADFVHFYQAYSDRIADAALRDGRFSDGWRPDRATWIKPSIEWMLYRSGYARKPGQERVLRLGIRHADLLDILGRSLIADFVPADGDERARVSAMDRHPVRVQWDPARDLALRRMPWRAIQIGITSRVAERFRDRWVATIEDVTATVRRIEAAVRERQPASAIVLPGLQREYALPDSIRARLGMVVAFRNPAQDTGQPSGGGAGS
jgi:hypothetical protein